jgi:hypothetical protein
MGPETKNSCAGEGQQQITDMLLLVVKNRGPEDGSNKRKSEVPALPINVGPVTCIFSEIVILGCS